MGAIWFPSFTFLAETGLAGRLYGEGWSISVQRLVGRKMRVACPAARSEGRSWISEDGCGVRPVQKEVEGNANDGRYRACNTKILAEDTPGVEQE